MKTKDALVLAGNGYRNVSALARLLGVKRQTIQTYGEQLPAKRVEILKKLCPNWFKGKK